MRAPEERSRVRVESLFQQPVVGSFISVCGLFTLDFMPGTILRLRCLGALVDSAGLIWLGRYLAPYPFPHPPGRRDASKGTLKEIWPAG